MPSRVESLNLVIAGEKDDLSVSVQPGERLRLRFTHSIHGSLVEETFAVRDDGFALVRLRYSELRTAEYYGHETARRDGDWWTVDDLHRFMPTLALRVSAESDMRLRTNALKIDLATLSDHGGAVRLSMNKATAA